jgi:aspartyl-tRNA(Asn)/glutamyl-tRNA(Gln) amidotransferase subunit C
VALDQDTVRRIAVLARLQVAEAQIGPLAGELSGILGWVEQLAEVDTTGVAPLTSAVDVTRPLRADVVADGGQAAAIVANAPLPIDDYFAVPKVVE